MQKNGHGPAGMNSGLTMYLLRKSTGQAEVPYRFSQNHMNKNNWKEVYKERFGADYAEWGRDETTEEAIGFIKFLLSEQEVRHKEHLESIAQAIENTIDTSKDLWENGELIKFSEYNLGLGDAAVIVRSNINPYSA